MKVDDTGDPDACFGRLANPEGDLAENRGIRPPVVIEARSVNEMDGLAEDVSCMDAGSDCA